MGQLLTCDQDLEELPQEKTNCKPGSGRTNNRKPIFGHQPKTVNLFRTGHAFFTSFGLTPLCRRTGALSFGSGGVLNDNRANHAKPAMGSTGITGR